MAYSLPGERAAGRSRALYPDEYIGDTIVQPGQGSRRASQTTTRRGAHPQLEAGAAGWRCNHVDRHVVQPDRGFRPHLRYADAWLLPQRDARHRVDLMRRLYRVAALVWTSFRYRRTQAGDHWRNHC